MPKKSNGTLLKSFGLKMGLVIVVSSVIGSGVFKKVAPMAAELHSSWLVIIAWILAGVIILFGALSVGELGTMFPDSGGPYSWLKRIYGKRVSFLYGWTCFTVIETAAIASIAFIFAGALETFITLPHLSPAMESFTILGIIQPFDNIGAKLVAILLILLLTSINMKGAKQGGRVSLIFTVIIVLCILLVSGLSLGSSVGSMENFTTISKDYPVGGFTIIGFISIMVIGMRDAFWSYEGWLALGFVGEELKQPHKTFPRSMIIGILLIMGLYVLINFGYLYVMPIDEMVAKSSANPNIIPAVLVMDKLFGESGAKIISAMILISTAGCTNATILVSARIYYAMAKKGLFFKKAGELSPKHKTPNNSLKYQAIWSCILVFSGSFYMLSNLVIIAAFIFYGLIVFGVILLRIKRKDLKRPYKTIGYPVMPVVFILFCIVLLIISVIESPWKSGIGIILILSGLPFYYYWKKKNTVS